MVATDVASRGIGMIKLRFNPLLPLPLPSLVSLFFSPPPLVIETVW